jgi:hypothetical protein
VLRGYLSKWDIKISLKSSEAQILKVPHLNHTFSLLSIKTTHHIDWGIWLFPAEMRKRKVRMKDNVNALISLMKCPLAQGFPSVPGGSLPSEVQQLL